eukprot:759357_1
MGNCLNTTDNANATPIPRDVLLNNRQQQEQKFQKCGGVISECDVLTDLSSVMRVYMNMNENKMNLEKIDIGWTLDNFLHLLSEHNDDEGFESIYNKISGLDKH